MTAGRGRPGKATATRVVIALGGNALLRRGEPLTEETQERNARAAAEAVAAIARQQDVIVTHGNGPQVGLLALASEAYEEVPPYGLDVLGAESQGMIGFLLEQALRNCLPGRAVASLLTSVLVAADDPAFAAPTKPIGPVYPEDVARRLAAVRGWRIAPDRGGYRRVVPAPQPLEVLELPAIRVLVENGVLVICAGGGGVPVRRLANGSLEGVEGVIDKDLTSALLAEQVGAERLLLLTDVDAVYAGWATPAAFPLHEVTAVELRRMSFEPGSMAPKVEAACRFVERTGGVAAIGALSEAAAVLAGRKGTIVRPGPP